MSWWRRWRLGYACFFTFYYALKVKRESGRHGCEEARRDDALSQLFVCCYYSDGSYIYELILQSMSRDALPLSTSRKFSRRARAYRRAYREGVDNEQVSIEKMVKVFKTHRNAKDFASAFIRDA